MAPLFELAAQSDFKSMVDIGLSYKFKYHNGDFGIKVSLDVIKTTFCILSLVLFSVTDR